LASGHIDEMEEWVAIHQRQIGDADYSVPKHSSDARPHLPTKGLICIGRNSCTDYYFIDPRARTADGTCPVLLYLHEVAFACDVVAPSVASFAGYEVARMWADRECASHLAKRLEPQKTAVAAIDRD
jgi:hypothetical protein